MGWSGATSCVTTAVYESGCDAECGSCSSCPECDPGTYQPYAGQATCYSCPAGSYGPSIGLTSCTSCEVGRYAVNDGSCSCTACEPGTYSGSTGGVVCASCAAGTYQTDFEASAAANGAATCASCAAGTYLGDDGLDETLHDNVVDCVDCAAGTYSGTGASSCDACGVGTHAAGTGSSGCSVCAAGYYVAFEAQASCTPCASGTYNADDGTDAALHDSYADCSSCAAGTYSTGGAEDCASCAAGVRGRRGNAECTVCRAGRYVDSAGASACSLCPAQTFLEDAATDASLHDELGDCADCAAGLWCAPTFAVGDATLDLGAVGENGGPAALGELGCSDIDGDSLQYVITAGDDAGLFSAAHNVLSVAADAGLDYETATSYTLTIVATETDTEEAYSATVTVLVTVNDVNDIALTSVSQSTLSVVGGETVVISGANLGPYGDSPASRYGTTTYWVAIIGVSGAATQYVGTTAEYNAESLGLAYGAAAVDVVVVAPDAAPYGYEGDLTFDDCAAACAGAGATMPCVANAEQNLALATRLHDDGFTNAWLGYARSTAGPADADWTWFDGCGSSFSYWSENEPNDSAASSGTRRWAWSRASATGRAARSARRNCTLVGDGALECLTSPGLGEALSFTVEVAGQTSEPGGSLSYATPEVFDLRPRYVPTAGGAVVVINGTDLGLQYSQSYVEVVVDGRPSRWTATRSRGATPGGSDAAACGAGLECVEFVVPAMADDDHVRAVTVTVGSAADPTIVLTSGNVGFEYEGPDHLGDKASEEHSFEILSPRVVTEDSRFQPDADGYRTDGKTDGGEVRTVAVAGYHFSAPWSVSATLVGRGGAALTFYGDNFGPGEDAVTLGGVACTVVSWTHNEVVVSTPAGQGGPAAVVTVVDQAASKPSPTARRSSPPWTRRACLNTGGQITITGSDFGLDPVISLPLDADRAVAASAVSHDHSTIVLNVGAGQGRNDLTINVGGQVAVEPYAYAAPVVAAVSPDEAATEAASR
ncbi:calcium ion binding protein [Aureococcus anophagefferens]|nr:calcium ion binding protein [Aureococcus anophagefferens]